MTSLYNPMPDRICQAFGQSVNCDGYTEQGREAWYYWRVRFPSGVYVPRAGSWNIRCGDDTSRALARRQPTVQPSPVPYFGVQADGTPSSPGTNPRLIFDFRSGHVNSDGTGIENNFIVPEHAAGGAVKPLQYDHWYDVVAHYKWAPNSTGAFEWYVDGALQYRNLAITTMHIFCDGTSYPYTFGEYNYQRDDGAWPSGADFKSMSIGPTAASVGFTP